ncbi:hypothetical protein [Georgenia ruanii]|uniref:hypothetical protein n=1 Tax=Georgenia ruanii TaxID=348442 RepID=UPI001264A3CD|nr:hypothetical protein [Georgenia ruanii]
MRAYAIRGLVAVAFVVVLLSSSLGSTALWSAQASMSSGQVTSGQLDLTQDPMTITLSREGTTRDVSTTLCHEALRPGDVLTYRVPVTPVLEGTHLEATLALDVSGLVVGPLRDVVGSPSVSVETRPQGLLPAAPGPWHVTPALHDKLVTGIVTVTIPESLGGEHQGRTLEPGTIRWTLTQA